MDPSDLNYPSIAVGDLTGTQTITRTVTNVGQGPMTYTAEVEAPAGTEVTVSPSSMTVPANGTATFEVTITRTDAALEEYTFGALTWVPSSSKVSEVRSPIAVRPVGVAAPGEVVGSGAAGSTELDVTAGFTGTLTTEVAGLLPSVVTNMATGAAPGLLDGFEFLEVPEGVDVLRIATYADEVSAEDIDLNLYTYDGTALSFVAGSGTASSTELITVESPEAATYVIAVDVWSEEAAADVRLHTWQLDGTDAGNLTVAPASVDVTMTETTTLTASWTGLEAATRYLGQVNYLNGSEVAGSTLVTVNP
jgi:hypothetical protein